MPPSSPWLTLQLGFVTLRTIGSAALSLVWLPQKISRKPLPGTPLTGSAGRVLIGMNVGIP
jgi:hypothetical protein